MGNIRKFLIMVATIGAAFPFLALADEYGQPHTTPARLYERIGTAGDFYIGHGFAFALLLHDRSLLRLSSAPECDLTVGRMGAGVLSFGGTLTIGGDAVGQLGGLESPLEITPTDPLDLTYFAFLNEGQAFYPHDSGQRVTVSLQGAESIPKLPLTTLRSPRFADVVEVTTPIPTETGEIIANAEQGLNLSWTVPPGHLGNQKLVVGLFAFANETEVGNIRCGYPLKAGKATVPAPLMKALKNRLGGGPAFGFIHVRTGDFKIIRLRGASYTVEVSHEDGTAFATGLDTPMTIQ